MEKARRKARRAMKKAGEECQKVKALAMMARAGKLRRKALQLTWKPTWPQQRKLHLAGMKERSIIISRMSLNILAMSPLEKKLVIKAGCRMLSPRLPLQSHKNTSRQSMGKKRLAGTCTHSGKRSRSQNAVRIQIIFTTASWKDY